MCFYKTKIERHKEKLDITKFKYDNLENKGTQAKNITIYTLSQVSNEIKKSKKIGKRNYS